ncbi:hypothetical protein ABH926_010094 [Catenulispora sp. GP43]|uniref:Eco57I restriction-modification methylase domain-containing protein n=1 Tax=Catenulispora sp. GP43 TaxID=3156263 RepID=UPI003511D0D4
MTASRYGGRRTPPTGTQLHRNWLELVDRDGPFIAVPALKRVWPQGMPQPKDATLAVLKDSKAAFEKAWERWDRGRTENATSSDEQAVAAQLDHYRQERDRWVETVLRDVFEWGEYYTTAVSVDPVHSPDHSVTVSPTGALRRGDETPVLVLVVDPVDSLREPLTDGWATTPIDRTEELLRTNGVPIGVVTDGRWWAIVSARQETVAASGIVDAQTWIEEPQTRNAFIELLHVRRLLGGKPKDRLTELFGESVAAAEEITEALGTQVRRAVELLVQALSEAGLEARRAGAADPLPEERGQVYEAAVTIMMRVVFLLFAEERGLLPTSQAFVSGYGISEELDTLDARAREEGAESLDATHLTWHRLLATSCALYAGASFEDIRIPSYGGSLFDPIRFPFLDARSAQGPLVITVSDRVMLEMLRAVQIAKLKGQSARISFRDIDVEQIGYIYEGLLGYTCKNVDDETGVVLGLIGKEGEEPEIPLAEVERLGHLHAGTDALAEAIREWVKNHQPAATASTKAALAKALRDVGAVEDAERALRAITSPDEEELRDRLRPFVGIIRRDLRGRLTVVRPGGVLVAESPSRSSAGAHYTPQWLAKEVVQHTLQPLVYKPGPYDRPEDEGWVPVSWDQILELKVADIACGSGAFLVAAARYLAERLVEAWQRDGVSIGTPQEQHTHAMRTVVANCLYGADINGMAVEMCKLSLWLVSLDAKLPFSFVDDKILHGNSLLGLTDRRQLEYQHIAPLPSMKQTLDQLDVESTLRRATAMRRQLTSEVDDADPQRSATAKRRLWRDYQQLVGRLNEVGDAVIAAGLRSEKDNGKPGKKLKEAYEILSYATGLAYADADPKRAMLDEILKKGLTPQVETDYERWQPLHWILMVPDVMERGGFDAIIGNPPFLGGQKLTGAMGTNIRDWYLNVLASGKKGSADLVAYFFLRALSLLNERGNIGLIGTNTLWQGDTREVGLDQMERDGFTIMRAIQSRSWSAAGASVEYAAVWGSRRKVADIAPRVADDMNCRAITTLLEPAGRVEGKPKRLAENTKKTFQGCNILGMGFVLEPEEAAAWISEDFKNSEVLFPYLNGEDLNSRPDTSGSRWVIDFNDRTREAAQTYALPYERVLERVLPERARNKVKQRREIWWQFTRNAPEMRKAIARLDEVLVIARVSKTVMPLRVRTGQVFHEKLVVFATDSFSDQALLSSGLHQMWAIKYGTTMRVDPTYTSSGIFETFPRPAGTERLAELGHELDTVRREIMLRRGLGLTKLYNLINDYSTPDSTDADVARLRAIHVELDQAVMAAYGWSDVPLDHGFHTYRQMTRWTVSPEARVEIFDRLLEENHRRAAAQGDVVFDDDADPEDEGADE